MAAQPILPSERIGNAATAGLIGAYFLLGLLGTETLGGRTAPTSLIWPASGVGLALVLLRGFRVWPLIFAAALTSSVLSIEAQSTSVVITEGLLSGVSSVIEPLVAAWLIWRVAGEAFADRGGAFVLAMLVAVPVAAFVSAAPLVFGELSAGILTARAELGFVPAWYSASISDLTGMLTLAPPIWFWARESTVRLSSRQRIELFLFIAAIVLVFAIPEAARARYLLVAIHIAAALRLPLKWSAVTVAGTSAGYLAVAAADLQGRPLPELYDLFLDHVTFVTILNLSAYVTALLHRESEARAHRLAELASHLGTVEERERRRIARVLHDDLQQLLVAAKLTISRNPDEASKRTCSRICEAIEVARTLTTELHPAVFEDRTFAEAMQWLAWRTHDLTRLDVRLETDTHADPGSSGMRAFLLQAVRELLTNVVKHADTDTAWIRMRQTGEWLRIEVEDRGKGCDPAQFTWDAREGSKHGAATLKQRIELIGGLFEVEADHGCRIILTVPALNNGIPQTDATGNSQ